VKTSRLSFAALIAVAAVALLAACGSSKKAVTTTSSTSTNSSEAQKFAADVCGAFGTWKTSVTAAGKSLVTNPTKAGVQNALNSSKAATKTLKTTLQGISVPSTSAGQDAKKTLQTLEGQLQNDAAVIQRTIDNVAASGGVKYATTAITTTITTMKQQVKDAGSSLKSLPTGEVSQAFKDEPSCSS
jgi:uncharacterized lipoprotein YehR (DUF1307 family)